jgi:NAD(P) transhydrogenase
LIIIVFFVSTSAARSPAIRGIVHIIGDQASELIHIGQAVMSYNDTIDYFVDSVFNFPTMGEAYKIAALHGIEGVSA